MTKERIQKDESRLVQEAESLRRIGALLQYLRTNKNRGSQMDFARKLGYNKPSIISMVERGQTAVPATRIADFARLYGKGTGGEDILACLFFMLCHPDLRPGFELASKIIDIDGSKMERAKEQMVNYMKNKIPGEQIQEI